METSLFTAVRYDMIFIWGGTATLLMTIILEGSRGLGLSRMSFIFMLGTIFTSNRDHAQVIGFFCNFLVGWMFTFFYALLFASLQYSSWWLGLLFGAIHALFISVAVLPELPHLHPRMANEQEGPTPTRMLEPPGFLGLNYGNRTPLTNLVGHLLFGLVLGIFYRAAPELNLHATLRRRNLP